MLSTKDLVFKERPVHKLVERYVEPYEIEEVVSSKYGKVTTTKFNEDSSGSQCKSGGTI